jgi:hypothetical protein
MRDESPAAWNVKTEGVKIVTKYFKPGTSNTLFKQPKRRTERKD